MPAFSLPQPMLRALDTLDSQPPLAFCCRAGCGTRRGAPPGSPSLCPGLVPRPKMTAVCCQQSCSRMGAGEEGQHPTRCSPASNAFLHANSRRRTACLTETSRHPVCVCAVLCLCWMPGPGVRWHAPSCLTHFQTASTAALFLPECTPISQHLIRSDPILQLAPNAPFRAPLAWSVFVPYSVRPTQPPPCTLPCTLRPVLAVLHRIQKLIYRSFFTGWPTTNVVGQAPHSA